MLKRPMSLDFPIKYTKNSTESNLILHQNNNNMVVKVNFQEKNNFLHNAQIKNQEYPE